MNRRSFLQLVPAVATWAVIPKTVIASEPAPLPFAKVVNNTLYGKFAVPQYMAVRCGGWLWEVDFQFIGVLRAVREGNEIALMLGEMRLFAFPTDAAYIDVLTVVNDGGEYIQRLQRIYTSHER